MAFNLAALKGLFSKLKPAAKTIANYGDDVAGAIAKYGDDVARGVDYVDDFGIRYTNMQDLDNIGAAAPANIENEFLDAVWDDPGPISPESSGLNIRGKTFHWPTDNTPQSQLKKRLMEARSPADWVERPPLPSTVEGSIDASEVLDWFTEPGGPWGGVPRTTRVIGDVRGDLFSTGDGIVPGGIAGTFVDTPALPTTGMVMQDTTGLGIGYGDEFGLRPHKNTALGRWFDKQVPDYRWDSSAAISNDAAQMLGTDLPFVGVHPAPKHNVGYDLSEVFDSFDNLIGYRASDVNIDGTWYRVPDGSGSYLTGQQLHNQGTKASILNNYLDGRHTYDAPSTWRHRVNVDSALKNGIDSYDAFNKIYNTPYLKKLYEQLHPNTDWMLLKDTADLPF